MFSIRATSTITGVLFLLAAVSAILGLLLYDPVLNNPNYLIDGVKYKDQIVLGALFELILVVSAIGTASTMFPVLQKYNVTIALWHLCFRFMEAVVIIIGIVSVLSLLSLSQHLTSSPSVDVASIEATGAMLKGAHDWTFMLGPNFFLGINTFMYSYLFYKTKIVPRSISILGLIGSISIFIASLLEMFGVISQLSVWGGLLALPVFATEMILAVWLIVRGFRVTKEG
ncbi:DUF4386 domain-containing protein [Paenibacillus sp. YYML68]|uniref:DUF4386 domain-containing protein n=1 Tax=Paenibacillus sp. YYML68 TaxID=2909250 RepID=UPI002492992A|nr:DUF4386 domain-containing protein [Paenibacillus sp. YYML68]